MGPLERRYVPSTKTCNSLCMRSSTTPVWVLQQQAAQSARFDPTELSRLHISTLPQLSPNPESQLPGGH